MCRVKVVVLHNPRSGKGRGAAAASELDVRLRERGHDAVAISTGQEAELETALAGAGALIVVGGDGTLHRSLGACERSRVPVYHYATGNQNLLARECGHRADAGRAIAAIEAGRTRAMDLGVLASLADLSTSRRFALMASMGPDAAVIERLSRSRGKAAGHFVYLMPVLEEAWDAMRHPRPPVLRVWVDGKKVADDAGWLVISNCRSFALGMDPGAACAGGVDPSDGLLDLAFFPLRSRLGVLTWMARCRLGTAGAHPAFVGVRGSEIVVEGKSPWQADGEAGQPPTDGQKLRFECRKGALSVFCSD